MPKEAARGRLNKNLNFQRRGWAYVVVFVAVFAAVLLRAHFLFAAASPQAVDPFFWLENVKGKTALKWVAEQNKITQDRLESLPEYPAIVEAVRSIYPVAKKAYFGSFEEGFYWNFWQDESHPRGLLRRATPEEYVKDSPLWETVIDLDELARQENEDWTFSSYVLLGPHATSLLLSLSRSSGDKTIVREFDFQKHKFVTEGFSLPEARTYFAVLNKNKILVATDYGPDSLTESKHPRTIKMWRRGQTITQAKVVFAGEKSDYMVSPDFFLKGWKSGDQKHVCIFSRVLDFHHVQYYRWTLREPDILKKIDLLSTTSTMVTLDKDFAYAIVKEDLEFAGKKIRSGSFIKLRYRSARLTHIEIIFSPTKNQAIREVSFDGEDAYVNILDNLQSRVLLISPDPDVKGRWKKKTLPLPEGGNIAFDFGEKKFIEYSSLLTPFEQYSFEKGENNTFKLALMKTSPPIFDLKRFKVTIFEATSADGTKIPYEVISAKRKTFTGRTPTLIEGYGAFEDPLEPTFRASAAKVWLEQLGGTYVIAHVRGGGERGPRWHQEALKELRQKSVDDFIAVAEDIIARKISSPEHLGLKGSSNGGFLATAAMVQRPELFNAVAADVPILDMIRYPNLFIGKIWRAEYGDPEVPHECAALLAISPYHNLNPQSEYPEPFFTTSRTDDRLNPGHARKMAARMIEQGHGVLFYESETGGHAMDYDYENYIHSSALHFTYLYDRLR